MLLIVTHNSALFPKNAPICHRCPNRLDGICLSDAVLIRDHANANYCPQERYEAGAAKPANWIIIRSGWGEKVARGLARLRIRKWKGCKCNDRAAWLSRLGSRLSRRLGRSTQQR